jgi:hypothetical protein
VAGAAGLCAAAPLGSLTAVVHQQPAALTTAAARVLAASGKRGRSVLRAGWRAGHVAKAAALSAVAGAETLVEDFAWTTFKVGRRALGRSLRLPVVAVPDRSVTDLMCVGLAGEWPCGLHVERPQGDSSTATCASLPVCACMARMGRSPKGSPAPHNATRPLIGVKNLMPALRAPTPHAYPCRACSCATCTPR